MWEQIDLVPSWFSVLLHSSAGALVHHAAPMDDRARYLTMECLCSSLLAHPFLEENGPAVRLAPTVQDFPLFDLTFIVDDITCSPFARSHVGQNSRRTRRPQTRFGGNQPDR